MSIINGIPDWGTVAGGIAIAALLAKVYWMGERKGLRKPVSLPSPIVMNQRLDALAQAVDAGKPDDFASVEAKFKEAMLDHVHPIFVVRAVNQRLEKGNSPYHLVLSDLTPPATPTDVQVIKVSVLAKDTGCVKSFSVTFTGV